MAYKSQAGGIEKNGSLSSIFYCKSDLKEGSLQWAKGFRCIYSSLLEPMLSRPFVMQLPHFIWHLPFLSSEEMMKMEDESRREGKDPPNGQVLMVLSMDNNCSATSFDMELCAEKLKSLGVQVAADEWRTLIQEAILKPEVRRYMFYNSRAFQIAIAVIFYMSLWTNIYSTVQLCSFGRYWEASVLVTLAAVAITVVVILVLDRRQRKINMNTDVRLAAVNEFFIKHSLILGITDVLDGPHSILQLWFVHFSPERCLQSLSAHLEELRQTRESGLRHSLDQLCVVMEAAVQPEPAAEEASCEESPLLSNGVNFKKEPVMCNQLLRLIPEGPPEVMAQQLLVIFSGCYVRLLVSGRLPKTTAAGHVEPSSVPCLCQFIQSAALSTQQCCLPGR
ncbi:transmembrane protein 268 isoform X1 [Anas acuta]|uniref:transmembrane protein 268 isoform X1 n=3 Tax=Anas acuta TaxID=28680 RepID=UPI0035C8E282